MSKVIKTYSAQKQSKTGNGAVSVYVRIDDPSDPRPIEERIKEIRDINKEKNRQFKLNKDSITTHAQNEAEIITPIPPQPIALPVYENKTQLDLILDRGTGNTVFIVGSSKAGKSTTLMKLYDKYWADKEDFISMLWTCNPQISIYRGHHNLLKCGVFNNESEWAIGMEKKIQTGTRNAYNFLNLFDDCLNVRNSRLMNNLVLSYRNSKISSIISLQYVFMLSKAMRANINSIIMHAFNTDESIEAVIKIFLKGYLASIGIKKLTDQIQWYKKATADHAFIYMKPSDGVISFHKW